MADTPFLEAAATVPPTAAPNTNLTQSMAWDGEGEPPPPPQPDPPPVPSVLNLAAATAPFAYVTSKLRAVSGTGVAGCTVKMMVDGEFQTGARADSTSTCLVNTDGAWSIEVPTPLDTADLDAVIALTFTQTDPDTDLVSEPSPPTLVKFLQPPAILTPKEGIYLIEKEAYITSGTGTPGCLMRLELSHGGADEASAWKAITHKDVEVEVDGTWKIELGANKKHSPTYTLGTQRLRGSQKPPASFKQGRKFMSDYTAMFEVKIESTEQHMKRQHATHNRGDEARNALYLRKYQALQVRGKGTVTVEVGLWFFNLLLKGENPRSGVKPDVETIFKKLHISEKTRKPESGGVTSEDWIAIIGAIKEEKRYITSVHHIYMGMDGDNSGEVSLDEAAELLVQATQGEEGSNMDHKAATEKVRAHAAEFDVDGDGQLTFPEFWLMIVADRNSVRRRKVKKAEEMSALQGKALADDRHRGKVLEGGEEEERKTKKKKKKPKPKINVKGKLKSAELAAAMWGDMSMTSQRNAAEEARLARLETERQEQMRIQAEIRAKKEAERDAYREKMAELARKREWERDQKKKLEDERLASMRLPTPPKEEKKSRRGVQKQTLFRETKPLSAAELSVFLQSAAYSVFGSDDSKEFPESMSVTGHPNTVKVKQYSTQSKYVRRPRYKR